MFSNYFVCKMKKMYKNVGALSKFSFIQFSFNL